MPDGNCAIVDAAADPSPGPDHARLERQLDRLDELAEVGLRIARRLGAEGEREGADVEAVARAYGSVSRAVRLTIQLQFKLMEEGERRSRRLAVQAETRMRLAAIAAEEEAARLQDQQDDARARIWRAVRRAIRAQHDDPERVERLDDEAAERLDEDDDILSRPIGETIALLCKDLGVDPDPARLAGDAWASEIARGAGGGGGAAMADPWAFAAAFADGFPAPGPNSS